MKTAKEMFKELGYKIAVSDKDVLMYWRGNYDTTFIYFKLIARCIVGKHIGFGAYISSYNDYRKIQYTIRPNELKAITQQMKELGWIE